jgi:hypothetical protein
MSYIASNVSVGYMSNILAFENQSKLEAFLTGLGNNYNLYISFFYRLYFGRSRKGLKPY